MVTLFSKFPKCLVNGPHCGNSSILVLMSRNRTPDILYDRGIWRWTFKLLCTFLHFALFTYFYTGKFALQKKNKCTRQKKGTEKTNELFYKKGLREIFSVNLLFQNDIWPLWLERRTDNKFAFSKVEIEAVARYKRTGDEMDHLLSSFL